MARSTFNGIAPLTEEEIAERDARVQRAVESSAGTTVRGCRSEPKPEKGFDDIRFAPAIIRSRYNLRNRY